MTNTPANQDEKSSDRRNVEPVDQRGKDRRQSKKPYTGPERRKHERREH